MHVQSTNIYIAFFCLFVGCIVNGSEICQYKQKKEGFENQQWSLSAEGYIHAKTHKDIVLSISSSKRDSLNLRLADKKTPDHEEQRWNFVLPVFKQKSCLYLFLSSVFSVF
jgi:hypothetical protein